MSEPQGAPDDEPGDPKAGEPWAARPVADDGEPPWGDARQVFLVGSLSGVVSIMALALGATTVHTAGASRSLRRSRQVQAACLEQGLTPDELRARGEDPDLDPARGEQQ